MTDRINYNPDVLNMLANLSSDEVFTPPEVVNEMLDTLPEVLWRDPTVTFLDPFSKSGVFLREIARRLMSGLETVIPDRQKRIDHILTKQLYGIAITELTALLSRRSVYGSKAANSRYAFCELFDDAAGNIIYEHIEHTWADGKCRYCGASKEVYDRDETLESHAYQFIHTDDPKEIFEMRFDVIVGNPPYQLNDGGGAGTSAKPIYHFFVEQAKRLSPRYIVMIIPARWYSGGKGLDNFRYEMLHDDRIREIHDFPDATQVFPGVQIKGGVCYFLWNRDNPGLCDVRNYEKNDLISKMERPLLEEKADVFIRFNKAITILKKVQDFNENTMNRFVSSRNPFGVFSRCEGEKKIFENSLKLYHRNGIGYISASKIKKNISLINEYKIFIPKAGSGSDSFPHSILGKPIIGEKKSVCTETYLAIGPFENSDLKNVRKYIATKFFRFLVLLIKSTQNTTSKVYAFVPMQDFTQEWTDEKLYAKYGLNDEEIAFIDSMIRPMELEDA